MKKIFSFIIFSFVIVFMLIVAMKMVNDWHDSPEFQSQAQTALGILKKIGIVFWNSVIQITQEFFHRLFQNS